MPLQRTFEMFARMPNHSMSVADAPSEIRAVFFDLGETLVQGAGSSWRNGAQQAIAFVRDSGVQVGIISNTGTLTRNQLLQRLPPDFDFADFDDPLVLLSSETGLAKPDLRVFLLAAARAGVSPTVCAFVTEDLQHSLAAQRIGIRACRVGNENMREAVRLVLDPGGLVEE